MRADETERREGRGRSGIRGGMEVSFNPAVPRQLPRAQADNRHARAERKGDLRECSVFAADGDDGLRRTNDEIVPGFAQAGGQGQFDKGVGVVTVQAGQQTQRQPARRPCPSAGGLHHSPQSAADQDGARLGDPPPHLLRLHRFLRRAFPGADDRNRGEHGDGRFQGSTRSGKPAGMRSTLGYPAGERVCPRAPPGGAEQADSYRLHLDVRQCLCRRRA